MCDKNVRVNASTAHHGEEIRSVYPGRMEGPGPSPGHGRDLQREVIFRCDWIV